MECQKCGQGFIPTRKGQKYCGPRCYKNAKKNRYNHRHPEKIRSEKSIKCEYCGNEFYPRKGQKNRQKYCSPRCANLSRKTFLSIPECLEEASRKLDKNIGYVRVYCPMHPKANTWGYVYEHRLIVEGILGRYLETWEHVHHCNGKRWDNRPENLEVLSASEHGKRTATDPKQACPVVHA